MVPILIVTDCSVISAFVDIGCLSKLNQLLIVKKWKLAIPDLVLDEMSGKISRRQLRKRLKFTVQRTHAANIKRLRARYLSLGDGELAVVSYLLRRQSGAALAGLDDHTARNVAQTLGVKYIGTLGLLRLMYISHIINHDEMSYYCKALSKVGFHITETLIKKILE
ncbi:MAG: hypothetical protein ABSA50_02080 [Candidatus Bathyarchaeia archaeon]